MSNNKRAARGKEEAYEKPKVSKIKLQGWNKKVGVAATTAGGC